MVSYDDHQVTSAEIIKAVTDALSGDRRSRAGATADQDREKKQNILLRCGNVFGSQRCLQCPFYLDSFRNHVLLFDSLYGTQHPMFSLVALGTSFCV